MAARLGGKTAFIGKVGRDAFGDFLRGVLIQNGIDGSGLVADGSVPTTLAFVQLDENGDRSFTFYRNPGADRMLSAQEIKLTLIDDCRVFHFGSVSLTHEPRRGTTAAALASRYYKLDAAKTKVALTYAATNATDPGNSYYDYCQEFKYHNGASAQMGIMACELARGGWQGFADPYFGHWSLVTMQVKDGKPLPALYEKAFEGLGQVWYTEESFKRGPGGIPTTAAAKCGAGVRQKILDDRGTLNPADIKRVRVFRSSSMRFNYYSNPFTRRNHTNALFSFQFAACCALLHGAVKVELVQTPAIQADTYLVELAEHSTMEVFDCEAGRSMMKVIVEMKDGVVYEDLQDYGGSMHDYPSREFLLQKFWDQFNAYGKLPKSVGEKIVELADRIETLPDMREYTQLLTLT